MGRRRRKRVREIADSNHHMQEIEINMWFEKYSLLKNEYEEDPEKVKRLLTYFT